MVTVQEVRGVSPEEEEEEEGRLRWEGLVEKKVLSPG